MHDARLDYLPLGAPEVERVWRDLESRAQPSYFLRWGWIEHWLSCLPARHAPRLAVLSERQRPVAAFFVGKARLLRHGLIPSRSLFLNATGVPRWDDVTAEHNAVLAAPGLACSLADWVDLLPADWDELHLPALARNRYPGSCLHQPLKHHRVRIDRELPSPFVDLDQARSQPGGYLALLGANVRAQIRRARRGFGPLTTEVADSERHALDVLDELIRLHRLRWQRAGSPGAFNDPWFERFHRTLIEKRFRSGEIQLLRVRAGDRTVGCLYNFVSDNEVSFYQCGLAHFDDPRLKAGYACHVEAIEHNIACGHSTYDFLAGEGRYKRSLATHEAQLVWARIQRPLARFELEDRLQQLARATRSLADTRLGRIAKRETAAAAHVT